MRSLDSILGGRLREQPQGSWGCRVGGMVAGGGSVAKAGPVTPGVGRSGSPGVEVLGAGGRPQ